MSHNEINDIYANADMVVCGYAFTRMPDNNIQVLQLRAPNHALVLSKEGTVIETSMDDVEISIVNGYWIKYVKWTSMSNEGFYRG